MRGSRPWTSHDSYGHSVRPDSSGVVALARIIVNHCSFAQSGQISAAISSEFFHKCQVRLHFLREIYGDCPAIQQLLVERGRKYSKWMENNTLGRFGAWREVER